MFSKPIMENVSKCCGRKYTMEVIRTITYADGRKISLQSPGPLLDETSVCCGCHEPCGIVLRGEEMKPTEGGVYCQTCARRLTKSERIPEGLALRFPAGGGTKSPETTCWGCGKIIKLEIAIAMVKEEKR